MWSIGDGALVKKFTDHAYRDYAPYSAELLLISLIIFVFGRIIAFVLNDNYLVGFAFQLSIVTVFTNVAHDIYLHLWRDRDRARVNNSTISSTQW